MTRGRQRRIGEKGRKIKRPNFEYRDSREVEPDFRNLGAPRFFAATLYNVRGERRVCVSSCSVTFSPLPPPLHSDIEL